MPAMEDATTLDGETAAGLERLSPLIVAAAADVDRSLLSWMLSLSPRERLRVCTRASRSLDRLRRASA